MRKSNNANYEECDRETLLQILAHTDQQLAAARDKAEHWEGAIRFNKKKLKLIERILADRTA